VENGDAFGWGKAREFEFLERGGRDGGNLPPVPKRFRRHAPRLAQPPIRRDMGKLQREQLADKRGKRRIAAAAAFNERAEATGQAVKDDAFVMRF